jgi:hypothetical protein
MDVTGIVMSTVRPTFGPVKPGAVTPMTVTGCPSMMIRVPITPGARWSSRVQ